MQIRVSARHTSVREADRTLITEKIDRLSKYLPGMEIAEVHFFEERNPRIADKEVCEVTLAGHGHFVRCKANGPDHITAVDRAIDKLENKLHKLKTKLARKPNHRATQRARQWAEGSTELPVDDLLDTPPDTVDPLAELDVEAEGVELDETPEYHIVKTKKVEKLTLFPLEAALRMDLLSHPFYFFTNAETGRASVVYRRDDGDIGLIDEVD